MGKRKDIREEENTMNTMGRFHLPKELLQEIADRLPTQTDVSRFRSVCKWWRFSVLPFQKSFVLPHLLPNLPPFPPLKPLSLTETTFYHLSPPPVAGHHSMASSTTLGWLVELKQGKKLRRLIHLPQPESYSFPKERLNTMQFRVSELTKSYTVRYYNSDYKAVLSPNPFGFPSLMVVLDGVLWHLKLGQDSWTLIDHSHHENDISPPLYDDIIIFRGSLCAISSSGRTILFDSSLNITEIASSTPELAAQGHKKKKLVESNGELLMVDIIYQEMKEAYIWILSR